MGDGSLLFRAAALVQGQYFINFIPVALSGTLRSLNRLCKVIRASLGCQSCHCKMVRITVDKKGKSDVTYLESVYHLIQLTNNPALHFLSVSSAKTAVKRERVGRMTQSSQVTGPQHKPLAAINDRY